MVSDEYRTALRKLQLAADQIQSGMYDTARTVLHSAEHYGDLGRPEHLAGRLQHDALKALLLLRERRNVASASAQLDAIVRRIPQVRGNRAQESVWQCCDLVMGYLPHAIDIQVQLDKAREKARRKLYEAAYRHIQNARTLLMRNARLTPRTAPEQIATAADEVMIHLLENLPPATAVSTVAYLRKQGLIQG